MAKKRHYSNGNDDRSDFDVSLPFYKLLDSVRKNGVTTSLISSDYRKRLRKDANNSHVDRSDFKV